MNRKVRFGFSLLFTILTTLTASAQRRPQSRWENSQPASLAIRGGLTQLFGDLKDLQSTPFLGASLVIPVTQTVSVEVPFDFGTLKAQQDEFYHSASSARFTQVALAVSVDVLPWFRQEQRLVEVRPYAGTGLLFFRAEAHDLTTGALQRLTNNQNSHRSRDGIEPRGKSGIRNTHELVWLTGIRVSTALARRMSVFGDIRFNFVRTDKLDATLDGNNQIMQPGSLAFTEGNHYGKNSSDKWGYLAVGINCYFGERFKKR
ncbi:hypothetical protein ACFQ4C_01420 [Larkinella insperata]|uniref:Uncharacterized protein n=1 Tax=Larkinella insperata TaxID=332158 RepID=A0ABW3Q1I6_9BACT|nr:hypothetical protein [Larkinella insperata]